MRARSKPLRPIQSVCRAIRLVELLAAHADGIGLGAAAREIGLAPQTTNTLLQTLVTLGWATQRGTGAPYLLGPACHRISRLWLLRLDFAKSAGERVTSLSKETGEYVLLAALRDRELLRLVEAAPRRPLMVNLPANSRAPHTMATGKVLMAHLDPDELEAMLREVTFDRVGPRAPRTRDQLRQQLENIRRKGLIESVDEAGEGIAALAAPVRGAEGHVAAALGIALPSIRYAGPNRARLKAALLEAVKDIQALWGRD